MHATPVRLRGDTIGALYLFRRIPGSLSPADRRLGRALADATAISLRQQITLDQHRTVRAQLEQALTTRTVIEQAKGFLTARRVSDPDTAFHRLRAHARHHHLRLADFCRDIVNGTAVLPPPAGDTEGPADKLWTQGPARPSRTGRARWLRRITAYDSTVAAGMPSPAINPGRLLPHDLARFTRIGRAPALASGRFPRNRQPLPLSGSTLPPVPALRGAFGD
ncbi:ANTAR domain-containing protein [Streptomyces chrestomyceticus]|uniref:ANTAR domain-containing protein n=1 Tax=Streptomyces chrestomyceticus TaxID=68185 RepID=UPI00379C9E8C